jgi:acetate kinase
MDAIRILVINCGSSSIKFSVVDPDSGVHLVNGMAEKLDSGEAVLRWKQNGDKGTRELGAAGHDAAVEAILALLEELNALNGGLAAVGHRVVHGA